MAQQGKMIIALDCFNSNHRKLRGALKSANALSLRFGWKPEALSIVSPSQFNWPFSLEKAIKTPIAEMGQNALSAFLRKVKSPRSLQSSVVTDSGPTTKDSVRSISKVAQKKKASAVAVFTHANKNGSSFPGGFVSSLVHQSPVPVLVINSDAPETKKLKSILLATDFSHESEKTFSKTIELAKKVGAKLKIVHVLPSLPMDQMVSSAGISGGWSAVETYLVDEQKRLSAKAKCWADKASALGVRCDYVVLSGTLAIAQAVMKTAEKEKSDLIVVTEKTGPWASVVLGSVTREILSKGRKPVLVYSAPIKGH